MTLWFMQNVAILGCSRPPELTIVDKAYILEEIERNPLQAVPLCAQIREVDDREFCHTFAMQVMPKSELEAFRNLCDTVNGLSKGECWFQVAEQSRLLSDCANATPFVEECHIHLAVQELMTVQPSTWAEIEEIGQKWKLDSRVPQQGSMLYQFHFRNTSQLNYMDCQPLPNQSICHNALLSLYVQRIKEWELDPKALCQPIPDKLTHSDQAPLKEVLESAYQRKCS